MTATTTAPGSPTITPEATGAELGDLESAVEEQGNQLRQILRELQGLVDENRRQRSALEAHGSRIEAFDSRIEGLQLQGSQQLPDRDDQSLRVT